MPQNAGVSFTGPLGGMGNSMAQAFGIKQVQVVSELSNRKDGEENKLKTKGIRLPILLWLGARLPFAASVSIFAMFTYMYHIIPILPWMLVFFSCVFGVIVCWPPRKIGTKHRSKWDWGPMFSWALAIGFAVSCGLGNYSIIESWVNTTFLNEYKGVTANTHAFEVTDAGILTFTKETRLDTNKSAGYNFWMHKYCAAPVVTTDSPSAAPITFWAVGTGCCNSRGKFTCNSADDKTAHSAMILRPYNIGREATANYDHAIKMSAAANELEVAKEHVFVVWHKDPKKIGQLAWWLSTSLFVAFVLLSLCACCACQSGFTHISIMQM